MSDKRDSDDLEDVLNKLETSNTESETVSVREIYERIGPRSYGPLLLVPAIVALTPVGGIPTVPSLLALVVIGIAGQLLVGRPSPWLPDFLLRRSIKEHRLRASLRYLRPVARTVDAVVRPRWTSLTSGPFAYAVGAACALLALTVPPLEFVPFAGTLSWAAIALFALALVARDGLLAAIALALTVGSIYMLQSWLL